MILTLPGNVARMPALSIRQPWAWLIVNGHKPVENRDWPTKFRGQMLIHAGKKLTVADYDAAMLFIESFAPELVHQVPDIAELPLGGIVGAAHLVDCVTSHPSPWFTGDPGEDSAAPPSFGFVLERAFSIPFLPWKGRLGFFDVAVRP